MSTETQERVIPSIEPKQENDFYWSNEREPHFLRRQEILKAHPEVTKLFGINPNLRYASLVLVLAQMAIAFFSYQLGWIPFLLVSYFVGATMTHALFLAIHEITHDLAFKTKRYNNWLAMWANIPIVFPYAMSFKVYHAMHHWEQGKDGIDVDIPTHIETKIFRGFIGKLFWFFGQIIFYAFRPIVVKRIKLDKWQVYNILFQVAIMGAFFFAVSTYAGTWMAGANAIFYLLFCMLLAGSLHPTSGHFISEHYVFHEGQETYSYYGPLNLVTFNVGYHNEHHDFPTIPGSRLPELKKMAPEYYDHLHSYKSWTGVILGFLFRRDVTLFSRTKRK